MQTNLPEGLSRADLAHINGPKHLATCVCGHIEGRHTLDGECCEKDMGVPCDCGEFVASDE